MASEDSEERQKPSGIVQVNSHSPEGVRGGCLEEFLLLIFTNRKTTIGARQPPGIIVLSKQYASIVSFTSNFSVTHSNTDHPTPLHLPVASSGQTSGAQDLRIQAESVHMSRVRQLLLHKHHCTVVVRESQFSVGCVWIQSKIMEIL